MHFSKGKCKPTLVEYRPEKCCASSGSSSPTRIPVKGWYNYCCHDGDANGNAKMTIRGGVALPCKLLAPLLPLALLTMLKMLTLNTLLTLLTQCHTCLYIFLFGYSVSTFWSS